MASIVKQIASIILVCGLVEVLTLQTHAVFQLQKGEGYCDSVSRL